MNDSKDVRTWKDAGGTPGGLGTFFMGLVMTIAGGYLITNQVTVTSGFWMYNGQSTFGLTLVPVLFGIALLFFNGRSMAGWLLTGGGVIIILAGIITRLNIYFQPTSLFNTLLMFFLLFGGLGLLARSVQPRRK